MKCLVTGAGGQLATELIRHAPASSDVHALDIETLDITSAENVMKHVEAIRPEVVFNAAAWTDVDGAESMESEARAVNRSGPGNLAEACRACGSRMVHVSTYFVFNGQSSTPYKVSDQTGPLGVYGRTKLEGEEEVMRVLGGDAIIVRTAWLYSPHGKNFLKTMLNLMSYRTSLSVVSDQRGTPTSAGSLARTLWDLVDTDASGVHHWTDGGEATWHEFAMHIHDSGRAMGLLEQDVSIEPIATKDWPTPAERPSYSVLDISESTARIGRDPLHWRDEVDCVIKELASTRSGGVTG